MAGREAITQEFYNNEDHQNLLLYNVQPTGTLITSGCGTYGRVEKVKVGHVIHAGKTLHDRISLKSPSLSRIVVADFVQECKRISSIDHLNVARVIGTCMLPNYIFPLIVMELMDNNLHHYLEMRHVIPLILKQSILEDVARGLLYLHKQSPDPIVHSDLTAYNVLLSSSLVAKITDIGNSTFAELVSNQTSGGITCPPDMVVYMPPEYWDESKKNSPSLDVFSYGHLVLFTAIQIFPNNLLPPDYCNPDNPDWIEGLSEVDRRRQYFKQMDLKLPYGSKNPLAELAQDCLCNDPQQRPPTEDILARVKQMVEEVGRIPGDNETLDRMEVIKLLHQQDKIHTMIPQERDEFNSRIQALETDVEDSRLSIRSMTVKSSRDREEREKIIEEKDIQISELETQVERLQAENSMTVIRFKETLSKIAEKKESQKLSLAQVGERLEKLKEEEEVIRTKSEIEINQLIGDVQLTIDPVLPPSPSKYRNLDLVWDQLPDLPVQFPKHPNAVFLNGCIYVGGVASKDHAYFVYEYDLNNADSSWTQLTRCPRRDFGMAAIKNTLVIVGGIDSSQKRSGRLTVWDSTVKQWKESFYPSLISARSSPGVVVHGKWLLVIGGTVTDKPVTTVEKFDVSSHKSWSLCAPLPEKCTEISSVVIEDTLYVAGSLPSSVECSKVVYSVLVPLLTRIKHKDTTLWKQVPVNIPNSSSSISSGISRHSLLAFGGEMSVVSSLARLSPILGYDLRERGGESGGNRKWERIGSLPCERNYCTCLRLSENKVAVIGGYQVQSPKGLRRVDVGTFQSSNFAAN